MQLMMRRQGSLQLAAALHTQLDEAGRERTANARLTLALRHYERALAPGLMATASAAMQTCAVEARLELSNFYLSWAGGTVSGGGGSRTKHLESALHHAREALEDVRHAASLEAGGSPLQGVDANTSLPAELIASLAEAEKRALLELLRAHAAAGNQAKAAHFREEYRAVLSRSQSD